LAPLVARAQSAGRIVVVGGGFAGVACARTLKRLDPKLSVTLVEPEKTFTAYPLSNDVLGGFRDLSQQQFGYDAVEKDGITLARTIATAVDPVARTVTVGDGTKLSYDKLVMAPGVDLDWRALPGYGEAAAEKMPHAWKGGAQIALLRRQLEAMEDGGVVGMAVSTNPTRCPPGAYERACLIAYYLKTKKPKSKLLLLDSKDQFSMQRLFEQAWSRLYSGIVERVPLSQGGNVTSVDTGAMTLVTDFETYKVAVANVIPPQKAAAIAAAASVADRTGWCTVEPLAFESTLQKDIHVLGDATLISGVSKSAFVAAAQGKVCAAAIVARLAGRTPDEQQLTNTCYSFVAPGHAIHTTSVFRPEKGQLLEVPGSTNTTPVEADPSVQVHEAEEAGRWFGAITTEVFG
jgi:NADPH-dependent 2,4-dienoyl-CoA reductase/sulfur reductase-like enzyme